MVQSGPVRHVGKQRVLYVTLTSYRHPARRPALSNAQCFQNRQMQLGKAVGFCSQVGECVRG